MTCTSGKANLAFKKVPPVTIIRSGFITLLSCALLSFSAQAAQFSLPPSNEALLGRIKYISTENGDTTASIAQRYNLGVNAIVAANPGVSERSVFPAGTTLKAATQFLLPPLPRKGIVINLPEMRMYYYLDNSNDVMTFPIGIGKVGKIIPITNTSIVRKTVNPVWIPPKDIREYNLERGIELPRVMPAGPDNPLGPYAIYLRIPTYLIHSTIFPESIGRRASFGCIRMNEGDIEQFFPLVKPGTSVAIIDMPNKVGWEEDTLYLEAHLPLEDRPEVSLDHVVTAIQRTLPKNQLVLVNWQLVAYLASQPDGIPHEIGVKLR